MPEKSEEKSAEFQNDRQPNENRDYFVVFETTSPEIKFLSGQVSGLLFGTTFSFSYGQIRADKKVEIPRNHKRRLAEKICQELRNLALSPFAKLMSKFLAGFLTASADFQLISS